MLGYLYGKRFGLQIAIFEPNLFLHIQGVTGGTDQTSGGCFLC